ncbi:hypothetical protein B0H13DRAFT_2551878 [Mycena leptocephala]|nr:hypothetical protein B0H13DRAFT_2551878 [Mycena leptocephala]
MPTRYLYVSSCFSILYRRTYESTTTTARTLSIAVKIADVSLCIDYADCTSSGAAQLLCRSPKKSAQFYAISPLFSHRYHILENVEDSPVLYSLRSLITPRPLTTASTSSPYFPPQHPRAPKFQFTLISVLSTSTPLLARIAIALAAARPQAPQRVYLPASPPVSIAWSTRSSSLRADNSPRSFCTPSPLGFQLLASLTFAARRSSNALPYYLFSVRTSICFAFPLPHLRPTKTSRIRPRRARSPSRGCRTIAVPSSAHRSRTSLSDDDPDADCSQLTMATPACTRTNCVYLSSWRWTWRRRARMEMGCARIFISAIEAELDVDAN